MTRISVVILNYNYARFLATAITSALQQTHPDVQVLVVDDASTDESRRVIERFGSSIESVFHEENRGQGAAINTGAALAEGEIVWFLDADDALLPDACATAAAAFKADADVAKFQTPLAVIDRTGRWSGEQLPADPDRLGTGDLRQHVLRYRSHGWPPMSGNAFAASTLRSILPVPEEVYRQAADSYLNEQAAICGKLARTRSPVAAYRIHGGNQFAGRPVSLEWLRTKIGRELYSHEQLGVVSRQLGLSGYNPDPTAARDVAFVGYRLASLRLDPAGHPTIRRDQPDTRLNLLRSGIEAARVNGELGPADRLLRSAWFVAASLAPRWAVNQLMTWYLPDGPSPPVWRRLRRRRGRTNTTSTVLVEPVHIDQIPGTEENDMTAAEGTEAPEVTIVVTPRERFGLSRAALESIYAHTGVPFRLVYVDGRAPRRVASYLEQASQRYGFELISSPHHLSPNQARNLGLARVDTPYVVFVDNDLIVTEGWLASLLECAISTGAWLVGPLYFEGNPGNRVVHMAGGDYELSGAEGSRSFSTVHRMQGVRLDETTAPFEREPVDFVEFHCMLATTKFLRDIGGLDEKLLSTREHLDLCMLAEERGGAVYFEPQSRVTYLTPPPVDLGDIPFFLRRWSEAWNEASLDHFCDKHGIAPTYGERIVGMRARRQVLLDPVRKVSAKLLPDSVDRFSMRVMARLEREANRVLFSVPGDG